MNIEQALYIMLNGGHVESLVSRTAYNIEINDKTNSVKLHAEGLPVDFSYLSKEEVCGEFREVIIIDSQDELDALSNNDRDILIEETLHSAFVKKAFDINVRNNKSI